MPIYPDKTLNSNPAPVTARPQPHRAVATSKFFDDMEAQTIASQADSLKLSVTGLQIESSDDLKVADNLLIALAQKLKEAEERRKFFVGPLNAHVRDINAFYKQLSTPLHEADAILRSKVSAYRQAERERVQREQEELRKAHAEALRQAEEAIRAAEKMKSLGLKQVAESMADKALQAEKEAIRAKASEPIFKPIAQATRHADNGSVGTRKVWRYAITDPSAVPREYCSPDSKLIAAAMRSGVRNIAGVNIYEDDEIWVRK